MQTVTTGFARIRDWVDVVGISTYGYAFYEHSDKGNPDNLPAQWLSQIKTIAPEKPYMVTETGWIAQDLDIAAYGLSVDADENSQYRYLEKLFTEANGLNAQGLILFTYHDYDTLWTDTLGSDNLSAIWKDTGLVGETHNERRALTLWRQWAARSRR